MQRRDRDRLEDMVAACSDVIEFSAGLTFEEFVRQKAVRYAILHSLTIIGEAASRISVELHNLRPELPWRRVIAFRHRLVHGYGELDLELVWEVAAKLVPGLRDHITAILLAVPEGP